MNPDEQAFLNAIIANPDDDLPRLVYADWLEERDQGERAEFIRVQCEIAEIQRQAKAIQPGGSEVTNQLLQWAEQVKGLTTRANSICNMGWFLDVVHDGLTIRLRRGFVAEVRVPTLAEWMGGQCEACHGTGSVQVYTGHGDYQLDVCLVCSGTGRTIGIGPRLCRENPIERVTVGNVEPLYSDWYNVDYFDESDHDESNLPPEIFHLLDGFEDSYHGEWVRYASREDANAALSRALIQWAEDQNKPKES